LQLRLPEKIRNADGSEPFAVAIEYFVIELSCSEHGMAKKNRAHLQKLEIPFY
jgi:hypothetical protein